MNIKEIKLLAAAVKALPIEYCNDHSEFLIVEDVDMEPVVVVTNKECLTMIFTPLAQSAWEIINLKVDLPPSQPRKRVH
jgi:hypothetical protein